MASHVLIRSCGDPGRLNRLTEGVWTSGRVAAQWLSPAASLRAASRPSSPHRHCIGLLHEAVRCSVRPKMSCSTGTSGSSYRRSTCNGSSPLPQQWTLHTTKSISKAAHGSRTPRVHCLFDKMTHCVTEDQPGLQFKQQHPVHQSLPILTLPLEPHLMQLPMQTISPCKSTNPSPAFLLDSSSCTQIWRPRLQLISQQVTGPNLTCICV